MSQLLLYLSHADDPQRYAVGPSLARLAGSAGWSFECYYANKRSGRHFGGGDPDSFERGHSGGGLVAGGRHLDQTIRLVTRYEVSALGDPRSPLWWVLEQGGASKLVASEDPLELYAAALRALGVETPRHAVVVDATPHGTDRVVVAPYLAPEFFRREPCLGVEASAPLAVVDGLRSIGVETLEGLWLGDVAMSRWGPFLHSSRGHRSNSYAESTADLARESEDWGQGILLGDPELVAAQLPRLIARRLLPLYGRPQVDVLRIAADAVRRSREPVFGRQYDDRDFFALAELGHGLQVLDPAPPFASTGGVELDAGSEDASGPNDDPSVIEGIPATLMFWAGMIREAECIPRIIDLVASTGLRCGLIITAKTFTSIDEPSLSMLTVPAERGGVAGLVELVVGSTGWGVAPESSLGGDRLGAYLESALSEIRSRVPSELWPTGWWPLLDTELVRVRRPWIGRSSGRPVMYFSPRARGLAGPSRESSRRAPDLRSLGLQAIRALRIERYFEPRRPYADKRSGALDDDVAAAAQRAGFAYMWTKSRFGEPAPTFRGDGFMALPLTAGNWDGWSPFYTVSTLGDLKRAQTRMASSDRGWVAGVIDTPLWLMSGEALRRGHRLQEIAEFVVRGGRGGRLVNVRPSQVAAYARSIHKLQS